MVEAAALTGGMGALLAHDIRHIARHHDQFQPTDAGFLGRRLVDLIAATVAQLLGAADAMPGETKRRMLRTRIDAFIDTRLADPALAPNAVADAHNISIRELYRVFGDGGNSVAEEIRHRRLERCRRDLTNPLLRNRPVGLIAQAWGFTHPEHFSRLFRRTYGMSPTHYRAQAAASSAPRLTASPARRAGG
ncbi:helix-turn-helix domain-containing protein [Dactylosporangium sp. CA-092794]|uniref:helix-turn-helix domain-containing protein n=1 Tax=Dactylosporangium sp. CA-092794 TaxID=3239929 RepID=UPI003D8E3020